MTVGDLTIGRWEPAVGRIPDKVLILLLMDDRRRLFKRPI